MIEEIEKNLDKCHIGVISKGRPKNITKEVYKSIHSRSTWYLSSYQDIMDYDEQLDELKINSEPFPAIKWGGKLVETRNKILDDAKFLEKKYAVMLDDDLTSLHLGVSKKEKTVLDLTQAIDIMVNALEQQDQARMIGVASTPNVFYFNPDKPISENKFCISAFLVVDSSTHLRFDDRLTLKEDYDFTLQHIHTYKKVLRADCILAGFKHYSNKGGVVGYRNEQREQHNIHILKSKWGYKIIRDNPRRKNEILLRVKNI